MTKKLTLGIMPVILGGLIYVTFRTDTLIMFGWFKALGLSNIVDFLRSNQQIQNLTIPPWVKFSLPDALWLFSFNYVLLTLWNFNVNRQSAFWLFLAPTIGLFSEIGQLNGIVPGTFDIVDLVLLLVATLSPFFSINNLKSIKLKTI
ncbi:hypothetical protein [Algoriphagus persicinus]|uniref:hypothetical protein n=1 Tax=Algoriphagus persicinus TaxID=3108754 RepID=UPI002B3F5CF9|nr:hypothetical protein [Algoriphagus sp. E1-3-M2]MEB2784947.1 hypothetical protein [Algoriphagus sp. E1-3-M2]